MGIQRPFVSTALNPGQDYTYKFKAEWTEGGRLVTQSRDVPIDAGEHLNLNFGAPAAQ